MRRSNGRDGEQVQALPSTCHPAQMQGSASVIVLCTRSIPTPSSLRSSATTARMPTDCRDIRIGVERRGEERRGEEAGLAAMFLPRAPSLWVRLSISAWRRSGTRNWFDVCSARWFVVCSAHCPVRAPLKLLFMSELCHARRHMGHTHGALSRSRGRLCHTHGLSGWGRLGLPAPNA